MDCTVLKNSFTFETRSVATHLRTYLVLEMKTDASPCSPPCFPLSLVRPCVSRPLVLAIVPQVEGAAVVKYKSHYNGRATKQTEKDQALSMQWPVHQGEAGQ